MNKSIVTLVMVVMLLAGTLYSQQAKKVGDIVPNWTKDDCNGVAHTLYDELDSGNVVIMDVVMTYVNPPTNTSICGPCRSGTTALQKLDADYAVSNPGRVRHYAMAYTWPNGANPYDCDQMSTWKSQCGFDDGLSTIIDCSDVTSTVASGMPLIIVIGPDRKISNIQTSWSSDHSAAIKAAIDKGLAQSAAVENPTLTKESASILAHGNTRTLELSLAQSEALSIQIFDILGHEVATLATHSIYQQGQSNIGLPSFPTNGSYIVRIMDDHNSVISLPFSVTR